MDGQGFAEYVAKSRWKFAKTMAHIPHEYTVREWAPWYAHEFDAAVEFIRREGYPAKFFRRTYIYYDLNEHQYWWACNKEGVPILINRAVRK